MSKFRLVIGLACLVFIYASPCFADNCTTARNEGDKGTTAGVEDGFNGTDTHYDPPPLGQGGLSYMVGYTLGYAAGRMQAHPGQGVAPVGDPRGWHYLPADCTPPQIQVKLGPVHTKSADDLDLLIMDLQKHIFDVMFPGFSAKYSAFGQSSPPSSPGRSAGALLGVSAVGEVDLQRSFGTTVTGFLGGARVTAVTPSHFRLSPFFQFLAGAEHAPGSTEFAVQPGFGVMYTLTPRLGVVGQLDFRLFPSVQFGETETRISGGISYALGK